MEYIQSNFIGKVDSLCEKLETKSVGTKDFVKLVNILEDAARHTIPNVVKSVEARIWDTDEELKNLLESRDAINRNQMKNVFRDLTVKSESALIICATSFIKNKLTVYTRHARLETLRKHFVLQRRLHLTPSRLINLVLA